MGNKGARRTASTEAAADAFVAALGQHLGVTSKAMFGGFGISSDSVMFALVDPDGNCWFRTDELTVNDYHGAAKHGRMPYHQVPRSVIGDKQALGKYAKDALAAAKRART